MNIFFLDFLNENMKNELTFVVRNSDKELLKDDNGN